jgi:hypothetical protein
VSKGLTFSLVAPAHGAWPGCPRCRACASHQHGFCACGVRVVCVRAAPASKNNYGWQALQLPGVLACSSLSVIQFSIVMGYETLWQPWLGVAPYAWSSAQIATVALTAAAVPTVFMPLVAMPLNAYFGDLVGLAIGLPLGVMPFLFLGTPPILFPTFAAHDWVPYVLVGTSAFGNTLAMPVLFSLPVKAFVAGTGVPHEEAAVPLGAIQAFTPYLGMTIGPLVAGFIIDSAGVGAYGMFAFCITLFAEILVVVANWQVLTQPSKDDTQSAKPGDHQE